ncbi:hypothetical protein [Leptospira sarikeiensis]|uniref:Uncharacterized protein n=1 Tax=Leptospira sarikeiensis TaxID=2484943 RepID=A0A4R9JZC7_9LEPT|nr:hypothetical protein [Leptospira sarikeiensis]TGL58722.1 hypothetical protein EHQ64_16860 [Leptospira sarikeiensis]
MRPANYFFFIISIYLISCIPRGEIRITKDNFTGMTNIEMNDFVDGFEFDYSKLKTSTPKLENAKIKFKRTLYVYFPGKTLSNKFYFKFDQSILEGTVQNANSQVIYKPDPSGKITDEDLVVSGEILINEDLKERILKAKEISIKFTAGTQEVIVKFDQENIINIKKFLN